MRLARGACCSRGGRRGALREKRPGRHRRRSLLSGQGTAGGLCGRWRLACKMLRCCRGGGKRGGAGARFVWPCVRLRAGDSWWWGPCWWWDGERAGVACGAKRGRSRRGCLPAALSTPHAAPLPGHRRSSALALIARHALQPPGAPAPPSRHCPRLRQLLRAP